MPSSRWLCLPPHALQRIGAAPPVPGVATLVCMTRSKKMGAVVTLSNMQRDAIDRLLSASEVAQMLGVSRRTFESLVAKRKVPIFIRVGRQRRWRQPDVQNWIAALAETAKSEQEIRGEVNVGAR